MDNRCGGGKRMGRDGTYRKKLGDAGEDIAAGLLALRGYSIVKRGYRCRTGEIDIVAQKGGDMRFVEVKTRTGLQTRAGLRCASAGEAVDARKRDRIRRTAEVYLMQLEGSGYEPERIGFDVIEVYVDHIEDAF